MMNDPTVSVIIPAYGHADFILAAVQSALRQSLKNLEVIVVNDGSPDRTAEVLAPLVERSEIRYVCQTNGGQAKARNNGLSLAKGKYIAFLDDDDIWPPDRLEWQVKLLQEYSDVIAVAGVAETFQDDGTPSRRTPFFPEITFDSLFDGSPIVSPGQVLIRGDFLRTFGAFNERIWGADDWDLWIRIAKSGRFVMENRVALHYRYHAQNASRDLPRMLHNACLVLEENVRTANPSQRVRLRRRGYRSLTRYYASQMIHRAKGRLKAGHPIASARELWNCKRLAGAAIRDPWIAWHSFQQLMP